MYRPGLSAPSPKKKYDAGVDPNRDENKRILFM